MPSGGRLGVYSSFYQRLTFIGPISSQTFHFFPRPGALDIPGPGPDTSFSTSSFLTHTSFAGRLACIRSQYVFYMFLRVFSRWER